MTLAVVVELEMVYITEQQRKRLLHPDVSAPLLQQVLVETPPIGDLREAVDARLFAFLRRIVALIDEDLDQNFQVPFLPRDGLNEFFSFSSAAWRSRTSAVRLVLSRSRCSCNKAPCSFEAQKSDLQIMILIL